LFRKERQKTEEEIDDPVERRRRYFQVEQNLTGY
jgi:hypothetical protein